MNLREATQKLLSNRVLIIILIVITLSLPFVILPAEIFAPLGHFGSILVSLASTVLTTAVVGLFFELVTRIEVREMFRAIVQESEKNITDAIRGSSDEPSSLDAFWRSFATEDTTIVVAGSQQDLGSNAQHDEVIRVADTIVAFDIMQFLMEKSFALGRCGHRKVTMRSIMKQDYDNSLPKGHLIVIGAPGANPMASEVMRRFRGVGSGQTTGRNGYVFRVQRGRGYLTSPFILPVEGTSEVGIADMKNGDISKLFPRSRSDDELGTSRDCALVVHGRLPVPEGPERRVLVFAGHSRRSTKSAVDFAVTNISWAEQIHALGNANSETVLVVEWHEGVPETRQAAPIRRIVARRGHA